MLSNIGFVLLLLVLAGELAYAAWPSHKTSVTAEAASVGVDSTTQDPQTTVTPTTVRKTVRTTSTTRRATTTTTKPAVSAPEIGTGSVTYTVRAGTAVQVVANGKCWVQARRTSSSPVLDEVILQAGEVKTYTAPLWLRIGNTTKVTVTAGTTRLQLPPTTGDLIVDAA
jgi:hypothetical protein